ncbi:MAG: YtxH domain-containing protein [Tunicatimonas sp.]
MDTFDKTALAFLLGATSGALTGLLLAPSSGAQTRHRITETAHDVLDDAETAWEEGSERVKDIADTVAHEVKGYQNITKA